MKRIIFIGLIILNSLYIYAQSCGYLVTIRKTHEDYCEVYSYMSYISKIRTAYDLKDSSLCICNDTCFNKVLSYEISIENLCTDNEDIWIDSECK